MARKIRITLVVEVDDEHYFADSLRNDVGEIPDDMTNEAATVAIVDAYKCADIDALDLLDPEYTIWKVEVIG